MGLAAARLDERGAPVCYFSVTGIVRKYCLPFCPSLRLIPSKCYFPPSHAMSSCRSTSFKFRDTGMSRNTKHKRGAYRICQLVVATASRPTSSPLGRGRAYNSAGPAGRGGPNAAKIRSSCLHSCAAKPRRCPNPSFLQLLSAMSASLLPSFPPLTLTQAHLPWQHSLCSKRRATVLCWPVMTIPKVIIGINGLINTYYRPSNNR